MAAFGEEGTDRREKVVFAARKVWSDGKMVKKNLPDDDSERPSSEAEDRNAILARRAMFIASAIAGLGLASCEGTVTGPEACLSYAGGNGGTGGKGGSGGEPQPCLSRPGGMGGIGGTGGSPQSCLTMTPSTTTSGDGGTAGTGGAGGGGTGGEPQPCLSPPGTGGMGGTGGGG